MDNERLICQYMRSQIPVIQEFIVYLTVEKELSKETKEQAKVYSDNIEVLSKLLKRRIK